MPSRMLIERIVTICPLPYSHKPISEVALYCSTCYDFNSGIARIMNSSNNGTVNAMSPYAGL
jgi:hypothetical protein